MCDVSTAVQWVQAFIPLVFILSEPQPETMVTVFHAKLLFHPQRIRIYLMIVY
jgi:hypothetical protein